MNIKNTLFESNSKVGASIFRKELILMHIDVEGTVKKQWKEGIGWKLITLALDRDPWKFYLMFLSREIDINCVKIIQKFIFVKFRKSYLNHVTRTITNGRVVYWSRVSACITWPLYCTVIGGISGKVIRTYK